MERKISENLFWSHLLLAIIPILHFLNSLVTLIIYLFGLVVVITLTLVVWLLSRFNGVPGIPKTLRTISNKVDQFLVGSLGDIKVFIDEPVQAARIRNDLSKSIQQLSEDCPDGVDLICHSTGAAIAFETLVLPENRQKIRPVKTVIMIGSIMNMVWKMGSRRDSFNFPIPSRVRLVNIFTLYDPAQAGPLNTTQMVEKHRKLGKLKEFEVSNEDDLFRDHSAY